MTFKKKNKEKGQINKLTLLPPQKKIFADFYILEIRKFCYLNYSLTVLHVSGTGLNPTCVIIIFFKLFTCG